MDTRTTATVSWRNDEGWVQEWVAVSSFRRLVILGRLVSAESGIPIPYQGIQIYHADHEGTYDETVPGDETTARINGFVRTDSKGRFMVSTVLPGDYGSTSNNRHIHTTVAGAKPEGYDF